MPQKKLWNNYEEIREEHSKKHAWNSLCLGEPAKPIYSFNNPQPSQNTTHQLSEYAVFEYAVNEVKTCIDKEIHSLPSTTRQVAALYQLQQDTKILIDHFKEDVKKGLAEKTSPEQMKIIEEKFLTDANAMLAKYEPQIESNESWAPFWKNFLFLVIGILPALISMAQKKIYGQYRFFDARDITDEQLKQRLPSRQGVNENPTPTANIFD